MEFDFLACLILLAAFAFAYLSEFYRLKKLDVIWAICAAVCAGAYVLVLLVRGGSMMDAALGLTVLAFAISIIEGKGAKKHAI